MMQILIKESDAENAECWGRRTESRKRFEDKEGIEYWGRFAFEVGVRALRGN